MTADELADLNGLLALEKCARARAGDSREEREIADDILARSARPRSPAHSTTSSE
jgi:hypothetical protein